MMIVGKMEEDEKEEEGVENEVIRKVVVVG